MKLLIIEDDHIIRLNLVRLLSSQAYTVEAVETSEEAKEKIAVNDYDLFIVDWMLPDGDGTDLFDIIREAESPAPILMLTAKSQREDIVGALHQGADDYVTKPFDSFVLLARIKALLRRRKLQPLKPILELGRLQLDQNQRTVSVNGQLVPVSPKEFGILEFLLASKNQAIDRQTLFEHVWQDESDHFSNTVDVHIRRLREKLSPYGLNGLIRTVRGIGYRVCDQ